MKALIAQRRRSMTTWMIFTFLALFLAASQAQAHYHRMHHGPYVPVAFCTTSGTGIALTPFVCCELLNNKGHHVWRDTWVPVSCKYANARAAYDMGCKVGSPVYGTDAPIVGDCQFSFSTGKYR